MKRFCSFLSRRETRISYSTSSSLYSSSSSSTLASLAPLIRNAQCAEIFRSSYFSSLNQEDRHISISVTDLDQLLMDSRTRPSLLLPVLECSGKVLGTLSNVIPASIARKIDESVNEGVVQCLNDSIRDEIAMKSETDDGNADLRETLKFHRDLSQHINVNKEPSVKGNQHELITQGIYQVLKLSCRY